MKITIYSHKCDMCGKTIETPYMPIGWYRVNSLSRGNVPHKYELCLREHLDFCEMCASTLCKNLDLLEIKYNHRHPQKDFHYPIEPGNILVME